MKRVTVALLIAALTCCTAFAGTVKHASGMGAVGRPTVAPGINSVSPEYAAEKAARYSGHALDAIVGPICNALVCVQVEDVYGNFNIGTAAGQSLLYFYPGQPGTSNIMVSVDGVRYALDEVHACDAGGATLVSVVNNGTNITVNYTLLGYLTITVVHTPVLFSATSGAILTETFVQNNDAVAHNIGVLYQYDTTVDGDDAARLYFGTSLNNVETCYNAPFQDTNGNPVTYWDAVPASNTIVGRGTFTGGSAVTPDHLAFGYWPIYYNTCWNRVCDGSPYGDSSVLYQWDESPVPGGGGTRRVATYYGVGAIVTAPGDLQIAVTPPSLQCINGVVLPNPGQLLVNITNNGGSPCSQISVNMSNGSGTGGSATIGGTNPQVIANLNPTQSQLLNFPANFSFNAVGGSVCFTVNVTSPTCPPNSLDFCVDVPACTPPCQNTPLVQFLPPLQFPLNECAHLCPAETTWVNVCGPLSAFPPNMTVHPGCNLYRLGCDDPNCPPADSHFDPANWYYNGACWVNYIIGITQGCVCITIDGYLPVELSSFTAVAMDNSVALEWTTASETNNDHFELTRDGQVIAHVASQGNGAAAHHYSYADRSVQTGTVYTYTLSNVNANGSRTVLGSRTVSVSLDNVGMVSVYSLRQNYPNPFNPTTSIRFDLVESGPVTLNVYNLMGEEVATLVKGMMSAGSHTVNFDASTMPSGLYIYKLTVNGFTDQKKMLLMK